MSELQRYEPYLIYSEESVDENPLIDFDEIDEGDWIKYEDIKYLQQQLQASQEECAALKVQVGDLKSALKGIANAKREVYSMSPEGREWLTVVDNLISNTEEQSLTAHDNEVIEKTKEWIARFVEDKARNGIVWPHIVAEQIRNLKTEGGDV